MTLPPDLPDFLLIISTQETLVGNQASYHQTSQPPWSFFQRWNQWLVSQDAIAILTKLPHACINPVTSLWQSRTPPPDLPASLLLFSNLGTRFTRLPPDSSNLGTSQTYYTSSWLFWHRNQWLEIQHAATRLISLPPAFSNIGTSH